MDVSEYCRDIETYLCRKNDGHLIRIVGPSFDLVSKWAAQGVPMKVALSGIDRYFERYYRKGPRRRPVKIDFCEADVLDVFDEWRRATGVTAVSSGSAVAADPAAPPPKRRGVSLPEHLERVLVRLSSLRATGTLDESGDPILDRVSTELDRVRKKSGGLRGDERQATLARLADLDAELLALATTSLGAAALEQIRAEASNDLAPFRSTMAAAAVESAVERTAMKLLRERLGLPTITFF